MSLRPPRSTAGVRSFVDYALVRQATLHDLRSGYVTTTDVCDPHPDLIRAALHHGEPSTRSCPVCRGGGHAGEELGPARPAAGDQRRARGCRGPAGWSSCATRTATSWASSPAGSSRQEEIAELSQESGDVKVYVVEVCISCGWNHLIASYVVGDGHPRSAPRRQRTVEDEWGT